MRQSLASESYSFLVFFLFFLVLLSAFPPTLGAKSWLPAEQTNKPDLLLANVPIKVTNVYTVYTVYTSTAGTQAKKATRPHVVRPQGLGFGKQYLFSSWFLMPASGTNAVSHLQNHAKSIATWWSLEIMESKQHMISKLNANKRSASCRAKALTVYHTKSVASVCVTSCQHLSLTSVVSYRVI